MKRFKAVYAKDALGEVSRDVWEPETPSERNEAIARTLFPNAKPKSWTAEDDIAEMRGLVDAGLIGMGWPPSGARLAVADDGSWREIVNPEDVGESEEHRWSFMWIDRAAEPLSEAYFLGKMAFCLVALEDNLARNDMRGFLKNSMKLGMYQTEIDVRNIALRYATVGEKQTKVLDDHRARANEKKQMKAERRQEIVAKVAAGSSANRGALVREVQKQLKELGVTVTDRTIRADLKKVGKTG